MSLVESVQNVAYNILFQSLVALSDYATIGMYAGSSLALASMSMLLPIETAGKALKVGRKVNSSI